MDFFGYIHAFVDLAEWRVAAVQEFGAAFVGDDEKLAANRDGCAGFGHGECAVEVAVCGVDFVGQIGVGAFGAVAAGAVFVGEVAALDHEIFDDAVEGRVVIFVGCGQFHKVGGQAWNVVEEADFDCAKVCFHDGDFVTRFGSVELAFWG